MALLLGLVLAAAPPLEGLARPAIERAVSVPGARAELVGIEGASPRCAADAVEVARPVTASGRTSVRLRGRDAAGQPCDGWAWARVRVDGPVLVTTRRVAEGEPLSGAVTTVDRELDARRRDPLLELPEGARASRALAEGTPLEATMIRVGPLPGAP